MPACKRSTETREHDIGRRVSWLLDIIEEKKIGDEDLNKELMFW
jgi:hypothetical protein